MLVLLVFHVVLILLGIAVVKGWVPLKLVSGLIEGFHGTIGITAPTQKQLRWVIVVWIASILIIVDMMLFLFRYVF